MPTSIPCLGQGLYQRELSKTPISIIATVLSARLVKSMELKEVDSLIGISCLDGF